MAGDRRSAPLRKQQQIEHPPNGSSGTRDLPRQPSNQEKERDERGRQDHPRQSKEAKEGPLRQAINISPEIASRRPPPKIRLNSEAEEDILATPRKNP